MPARVVIAASVTTATNARACDACSDHAPGDREQRARQQDVSAAPLRVGPALVLRVPGDRQRDARDRRREAQRRLRPREEQADRGERRRDQQARDEPPPLCEPNEVHDDAEREQRRTERDAAAIGTAEAPRPHRNRRRLRSRRPSPRPTASARRVRYRPRSSALRARVRSSEAPASDAVPATCAVRTSVPMVNCSRRRLATRITPAPTIARSTGHDRAQPAPVPGRA